MRMTSAPGTGRPPSRPPSPQSAVSVPSDLSSATETHHMRLRRSPVPPGERGTVGSWTTRRTPPSRSADQVAAAVPPAKPGTLETVADVSNVDLVHEGVLRRVAAEVANGASGQ